MNKRKEYALKKKSENQQIRIALSNTSLHDDGKALHLCYSHWATEHMKYG